MMVRALIFAFAPLILLLSVDFAAGVEGNQAGAGNGGEGSCDAKGDGEGCVAAAKASSGPSSEAVKEYLQDLKRSGFQIRLKQKTIEENGFGGLPAWNRTAMVVSEDIFYGRAILKIPRRALLSIETAEPREFSRELTTFLFEKRVLEKKYNITGEDSPHLLSLAYPLIAMSRDPDSVFREWLDQLWDERLPILEFTKRQRKVLKGTTVDGAYAEMLRNRNLIRQTAGNISFFRKDRVSRSEAAWALAAIMRHARVVHPHQDVRETRMPRMYLVPFLEVLRMHMHPDPGLSISFQEEIILDGKRELEMVVQIAKRDMPKGEEVFVWPGRLSNSEMSVRHGIGFAKNPTGIGRNITQPANWEDNPKSHIRKEYDKYDCTSLESFELRFSPSGMPMKNFVRCYRVSWFFVNGWYTPALLKRRRELDQWPPPPKYGKDDWLSWTQADQEVNRIIMDYCAMMRQTLKESIDSTTAADFRQSKDPMDRLVWRIRSEESQTFKNCYKMAKEIRA